jgi:hypothetical protein
MLQVNHIVPLPTPLILPEKKVCGSLTVCVDVDLMLLHCFRKAKAISSAKKTIFSNTGNPHPPPATRGEGRARESSGTRRGNPTPLLARCAVQDYWPCHCHAVVPSEDIARFICELCTMKFGMPSPSIISHQALNATSIRAAALTSMADGRFQAPLFV